MQWQLAPPQHSGAAGGNKVSALCRGPSDSWITRAAQEPSACQAPADAAPGPAEKDDSLQATGLPGWGRKRARVVDPPTWTGRPRSSAGCSAGGLAVSLKKTNDVPAQKSPTPSLDDAVRWEQRQSYRTRFVLNAAIEILLEQICDNKDIVILLC